MRSDEEALELVRSKAAHMRRRRRAIFGGMATGVVLLGFGGLAALVDGADGQPVAAGGGTPVVTDAPSTTDPDVTTTLVPVPGVPTTAASEDAPSPSDNEPAPAQPCPSQSVEFALAPDRPRYADAEVVVLTATGTNTAPHDCAPVTSSSLEVVDRNGAQVYNRHVSASVLEDTPWRSGQSTSEEIVWDQRDITGQRVAAGTYTATVTWRTDDRGHGAASYSATTTLEIG